MWASEYNSSLRYAATRYSCHHSLLLNGHLTLQTDRLVATSQLSSACYVIFLLHVVLLLLTQSLYPVIYTALFPVQLRKMAGNCHTNTRDTFSVADARFSIIKIYSDEQTKTAKSSSTCGM